MPVLIGSHCLPVNEIMKAKIPGYDCLYRSECLATSKERQGGGVWRRGIKEAREGREIKKKGEVGREGIKARGMGYVPAEIFSQQIKTEVLAGVPKAERSINTCCQSRCLGSACNVLAATCQGRRERWAQTPPPKFTCRP